jgi:hypothetical protein
MTIVRLIIECTFIMKLFGDPNVDIIFVIFSQS